MTSTPHVDEARPCAPSMPSSTVRWTCRVHTALPEWKDTRVIWELRDDGAGGCRLALEHVGLVPALECYQHCELGWDRFLASVAGWAERGVGAPYRAESGTCSDARVHA
jgi:hypothetical protein